MKTMISILAVVAVVQVGLAVWAFSGKTQLSGQAASSALLNFDKAQVDQVIIRGDDKTIELSKQDGLWQTAEAFPLDAGKMDSLLDKLAGLKYGLPVATSAESLKRFKVADDEFERRVLLKKSGDTVAELFLGTGSGVRKSHLRNVDQQAVYVAEIGSYDLPLTDGEWQDKTVLQIAKDDVTGIKLGDLNLSLIEEKPDTPAAAAKKSATSTLPKPKLWKADSLAEGQQLDQAAINQALSSFDSLRISKVLGKEAKPEYRLDKPEVTVSLTFKDGERGYQLAKIKDSEEYVVKATDREEYFELSSFTGKTLVERVSQEAWVSEPEQEEAADSEVKSEAVVEPEVTVEDKPDSTIDTPADAATARKPVESKEPEARDEAAGDSAEEQLTESTEKE